MRVVSNGRGAADAVKATHGRVLMITSADGIARSAEKVGMSLASPQMTSTGSRRSG
jgi:hypothetical protein